MTYRTIHIKLFKKNLQFEKKHTTLVYPPSVLNRLASSLFPTSAYNIYPPYTIFTLIEPGLLPSCKSALSL